MQERVSLQPRGGERDPLPMQCHPILAAVLEVSLDKGLEVFLMWRVDM